MPACSRRSNRGDSARDVTTIRTPGTGYGTDAKSSDFKSDFLSCIEITEIIVTLKLHETDRILIFWRLLWSLTFPYVPQKVRYIFLFFKSLPFVCEYPNRNQTIAGFRCHAIQNGWGQNMDQGSMDPHFGPGPWTTFMDRVHGSPSWTGSMDIFF